jgi:tetratricopeptide (TPR) repeat protein
MPPISPKVVASWYFRRTIIEGDILMRFLRLIAVLTLLSVLLSCGRDPKRYVQSGNKFFDRGKFKEAAIMYRNAINTSPKYGEAYYRLGLTYLKLVQTRPAAGAFLRAMELLPANSPEQIDACVKYSDILLTTQRSMGPRDKTTALNEVREIRNKLLAHNHDSLEGIAIGSKLALVDSLDLAANGKTDAAKESVQQSISGFRKVLSARPGDTSMMTDLAEALVFSEDSEQAKRLYQQIIDTDKTLLQPYYALYQIYLSEQKMPEAENILKRAIASHPDDYGVQIKLAGHYLSVKNQAEMTKVLDNLKSHLKQYPEAFFRAGDFYARLGNLDEAIRQYQEGVAKDPGHLVDYQRRIVEMMMREGKKSEAYEKNLEILKSNPKDLDARALKASFMLNKGDINASITELQSVVAGKPGNFVAHYDLGRAYMAKGELASAARELQTAVSNRSDYMPARLALIQLSLLRGDPDTALRSAQEARKVSPGDGTAAFLEATAYVNKGQLESARPLLDALIKANPNQSELLCEAALVEMLEKHYKEAGEDFRKAYAAEPSKLGGLLGMAEVRLLQNDPDGAIRLVAEEVKKDPQRQELRATLADVEAKARQYDKAIADFQAIVEGQKDRPLEQAETYGNIGKAYAAKGDLQRAAENYRKASQLAPGEIRYVRRTADLLDLAGKRDEALAVYRDALKVDPYNPLVLNNMAYLMSETGKNLDDALTLVQRALQQQPGLSDASDTLGWIYIRKNLPENAIDVFKNLTAKVKDNPTYHYHYALALTLKGDRATALRELKAALQNNPNKTEEAQIKELVQKIS